MKNYTTAFKIAAILVIAAITFFILGSNQLEEIRTWAQKNEYTVLKIESRTFRR